MRFLADMGVSRRVEERLRGAGHDVVHLRDLELQRAPDSEIFRRAAVERRIVLTFDLDFGEIAARCVGPWASVIVFRLVDASSDHVAARLEATLSRTDEALDRGAVVVVEEGRCTAQAAMAASRRRLRFMPRSPRQAILT